MKPLTLKQQHHLIRYGITAPTELELGDMRRPFVYDRMYGFFRVPYALHHIVMSQLYAFHNGFDNAQQGGYKDVADAWLRTYKGTCFRSSQSKDCIAWDYDHLDDFERDVFKRVRYLHEK